MVTLLVLAAAGGVALLRWRGLILEPEQREVPPPGRRSIPGSLVWVPATAGLLLCQYVVEKLIEEPEV